MNRLVLPRLYVILDAALLTIPETECAQKLVDAGVRLLQYRNKQAPARELFDRSKQLASLLIPQGVTFVANDRADVACAAGASGVHVGQEDLGAEAVRSVIGTEGLLGVSTHNLEQFEQATATPAAPWHVVPADHKWFTRLVVAAAIVDKLEGLGLAYPKVAPDARKQLKAARQALDNE